MPKPGEQVVTLSTLADGAALELFQAELERCVENILDPNTDPEAVRKVVLEVRIEPNQDREVGICSVKVRSTLAGIRGAGTTLFFGRHQGQAIAVESNPKQTQLFETPELTGRRAQAAAARE
jgi:hypothetical protein